MIDLLKKAVYTGLGFAALTRDKVEELARDLSKQAGASEQEGRELVDEFLRASDKAREDLETRIKTAVQSSVESLNLADRNQIRELLDRLDALAARVEELERRAANTNTNPESNP